MSREGEDVQSVHIDVEGEKAAAPSQPPPPQPAVKARSPRTMMMARKEGKTFRTAAIAALAFGVVAAALAVAGLVPCPLN
mmetsp:Transcript_43685/g.113864  ORF Transcript_43685/g.113864 Transcript_43685/m.113864 type:complete len:80 (+) Transcript_43685:123-362(+)